MKFLGELITVMQGLVLLFLGNHEYFGYSYSFSLGAVWKSITVITFHHFTFRELFLVIISSRFTSKTLWPNYFS